MRPPLRTAGLLLLMALACVARAQAQSPGEQRIDLNGIWLDAGRLIKIQHNGSTVYATHLVPKICNHRDGKGSTSEYKYSFKGILSGNKLTGKTCVCNYGENNKRGQGIEEVDIELTVISAKMLNGRYRNTHQNRWEPITITRIDCREELKKAKEEVEKWRQISKETDAALKEVEAVQDEATQEGLEAWETGTKRQITDLSPIPLGLDTQEEPAEEAAGWVSDVLDFFEKKLPKPLARGVKKFMWVKYTRDVAEQLGKQVTTLQQVRARQPQIDKIRQASYEAHLKYLEAVRRREELKKECPELAGSADSAAPAPASSEQAAKAHAEAQAKSAKAYAAFRSAEGHLQNSQRSFQQAATAVGGGAGETPTDEQIEKMRLHLVAALKALRGGLIAQQKGRQAWASSKPAA